MPLPTFDPDEQNYEKRMDLDYSDKTDKQIKRTRELIEKEGRAKLKTALDELLQLEKQVRLGEDFESLWKILTEVVKILAENGEWKELNENLSTLTRKRSQSKQGVQKMVQEAMNWIDKTPDQETKIALIETLRKITEGKIYVEVERARLIKTLAEIREGEGKKSDASDLLQEVQVETIGSMEISEKIEFILEQIRLCLDKEDYVRAMIVSKKITTKSLNEKEHQDLKIRFYNLMIRYYIIHKEYLQIFKCYQQIFFTPKIQDDPEQWMDILPKMVFFVILAEYNNEQHDFMHRTFREKKLEEPKLQTYRNILKEFVSMGLIDWYKFEEHYASTLKNHPIFSNEQYGKERYEHLRNRVIEKNIRTVAQFYSQLRMSRLARLLYLKEEQVEEFIAKMVTNKTIYAKIDRINSVVAFKQNEYDQNETLNAWNHDVVKLLQLVEKSNHLINKEKMVQQSKSNQ